MKNFSITIIDYGFCGGVSRADSLIKEIRLKEDGEISLYGELIHNNHYNELLTNQNIQIIDSLDESAQKTVIIRTHGIDPEEEKKLQKQASKVYDLTCPLVKSIQKKAQDFSYDSYFVIILGSSIHPEVLGIVGYLKEYLVISRKEEVETHAPEISQKNKVAVLAQSTFSQDDYFEITKLLKKVKEDIIFVNTLCPSTTQRQDNAELFAKDYDLFIVVGGKNSSNTKKVYEKALKESVTKQVFHIQDYKDLKDFDFSKITSVAISSGTSTPYFLIEELVDFLIKKGGFVLYSKEKEQLL
jgi:(E)-4-hydroxy-3-methyl-but-2-enyl pyrophosphate reductase